MHEVVPYCNLSRYSTSYIRCAVGAETIRGDSFLFKLEYEYDGSNLLGVRILPRKRGPAIFTNRNLTSHSLVRTLASPKTPSR